MLRATVALGVRVVLAALVTAPLVAQTANPVPPVATVRGRVVAAHSGEAIPNARVIIAGSSTGVRTDIDGRFAVAAPRNAPFVATKAGYVRAEGAIADATAIRMTRAAAISGRIVTDRGDPVVGALVVAATLDRIGAAPRESARIATDDRGEYRIGGLAPNTYIVSTTMADAARVSVGAGDERPDVDFQLISSQFSPMSEGLTVRIRANVPADRVEGSARISGSITSTTGRPLRALVAIYGDAPSQPDLTTMSNADGRYEFTQLPAGRYRVAAGRPGFSMPPDRFPRFSIAGLGLETTVGAGEERQRVDLELQPWGAMSGRIFDEAGDPVQGAYVGLMTVRYERGRRRLVPAQTPQRYTDDRGEFRIYAVPPGQYVLAASTGDSLRFDLAGYGPTYYPGTAAAAEARFTTMRTGDEISGLEFALVAAATASISGRLVDATGKPTSGGRFTLVPRSSLSARIDARIAADGSFTFRNVPPGRYVIHADRGRLGGAREGEFGAFPVTVGGGDVRELVLQTSTGSQVAGRVIFESATSATPSIQSVSISPVPTDYDLAPAQIAVTEPDDQSRFQLHGISGSRRLQVTRAPDGWAVRAIVANGRDITDEVVQFGRLDQSLTDVEVVLTDRASEVVGRVGDDRARPVSNASVIVFSADRSRWYPASRFMRHTTTTPGGSFRISGLPAGSYFVAAATTTPPGDGAWGDPQFLDGLRATATVLSIADDQAQSVTLRLQGP
jgi:hypothetical protein